jgi:CshA-type fibril repeat protein
MKNRYKLIVLFFTLFMIIPKGYSQNNADPGIGILMNPPTLSQGSTGMLIATVGNYGNGTIVGNSLRVTISVGGNVEIIGIASDSDTRWNQSSLTTGSANTINLTNSGGGFNEFDVSDIVLIVRGNVVSSNNGFQGNIVYITAANPLLCGGCSSPPQNSSQGNASKSNDNSETSNVTVPAPSVVATTDTPSVLPGTNTPSVILNDTINGTQAVIGTSSGQVTLTSTPNGPLTMNADGTITVAANTLAGSYPITYTICEVSNPTNCSSVTSNVTVTAVNDAPVAVNYNPSTNEDTPISFNVASNDADGTIDVATVDLDPATAGIQTSFTVANEGTYTVDNLGVVTFTPVANFNGTATPVNYTVNNNSGTSSNIGTINVTVLSAFCVKPGITIGTALKSQVIISTMNMSPTDLPVNNGYMVLESKTKGLVITRMTAANLPTGANAIKGMLVYDTTVNCLKMYDGIEWGCLVKSCTD